MVVIRVFCGVWSNAGYMVRCFSIVAYPCSWFFASASGVLFHVIVPVSFVNDSNVKCASGASVIW